jgi:hypothetical protein
MLKLAEDQGYFRKIIYINPSEHEFAESGGKDYLLTWVQEQHVFHKDLYGLLQGRKGSSDGSLYTCSSQTPSAQSNRYAKSAHLGMVLLIPSFLYVASAFKTQCNHVLCVFFVVK